MKNKLGIVTGGAGHVGRQVCLELAEQGCEVLVADKNKEAAQILCDDLSKKFKVKSSVLEIDLLDPNCFQNSYDYLNQRYDKIDYLANCAAFYDDAPGWGVDFEEESYEAWLKVMQVNTLAPFFLAQKLYPLLKKSTGASIVNVSSIYGLVGPDHRIYEGTSMTNPAAYAASKGGLQQVTKWLSTVMAPEVRVNTVTPGGIERGQLPEFVNRYEERTPLKKMATEEDVSAAIVYLLSDKAKYITGHNLVVDGGWTVW